MQTPARLNTRPYPQRASRLLNGLLCAGLIAAAFPAFAQQAAPDLRSSQTGLEQTDPPIPTKPPRATVDVPDPELMDELPGAKLKPAATIKPKGAPRLPALAPYTSYPPAAAQQRALRKTTGPARPLATTGLPPMSNAAGVPKKITKYDPNPAPPPTAAAPFINPPVKPAPTTLGPYDPVGFDVGNLRLMPYIEGDIGYETNPTLAKTPKGSGYARTEAGAQFKSDWSRHSLTGELKAGYTDYFTVRTLNHPDLSFTATGKIDVSHDTDINLESHFVYTTQNNAQTISGVTNNVNSGTYDYGAAAGITERFGRLALTLRGSLDRFAYENPTIAGVPLNLSSGNYNAFELRTRAAYEITPGFAPYLQASIDRRQHDSHLDTNGYARDSSGFSLRAGTTYEISRILTADINAGVGSRNYADARLKTYIGPVADLSLIWQATPLTTVTLKGSSAYDETTVTGASSIWDTKVSLQVDHALLRNFKLTGQLSFQNNRYLCGCRSDQILSAGLSANYSLTRDIVLRGSYKYTRQTSTDVNSRYNDNVFLLGLRLQH